MTCMHSKVQDVPSNLQQILQAPIVGEVFDAVVLKQMDLISNFRSASFRAEITQVASPRPDPSEVLGIATTFSSLLTSMHLTITAILFDLS